MFAIKYRQKKIEHNMFSKVLITESLKPTRYTRQ